jgi:hypothetical protein
MDGDDSPTYTRHVSCHRFTDTGKQVHGIKINSQLSWLIKQRECGKPSAVGACGEMLADRVDTLAALRIRQANR